MGRGGRTCSGKMGCICDGKGVYMRVKRGAHMWCKDGCAYAV